MDNLDDVEEATVTYLNEVDLENTSSGPGQEDCALLTLHEREIEKAILSEDVLDKYTKVSCSDHASCVKCKILNERNHITEGDRYQKMWDATTLVPLEDGTHRVKVDYQFRASPGEMFPVGNYKAALKNAMHVSRKAERDGLSDVLQKEITSRIERGVLVELSQEQINNLKNVPHNFCNYSIVANEKSLSTKFRLVSNSSTMNRGKSISTQELVPVKSLNSMMHCLYAFMVLQIPLTADISKAYEAIETTNNVGMLRLMVTTLASDNFKPRIFIKVTLNFGDKSSATFLEISILKFVVSECLKEVTKRILTDTRFSDNPTGSFWDAKEFEEVKRDLIQAFAKFNLSLKYILGREDTNPDSDGHEIIQPLFGLTWNRAEDTV